MDGEVLLAARVLVYSVLARAYAEEPDELFLGMLTDDSLEVAIGLVEEDPELLLSHKLYDIRRQITSGECVEMTSRILEFTEEFTRIFIGPAVLHASPWESAHVTGKRASFKFDVLDIREAYKRAGLLPERYRQVSDDYVGLELDFMTKLAQFALESYQAGDMNICVRWLQQAEEFLHQHLLKWIDSLAVDIRGHYGVCLYASITELVSLYAKRDFHLIADLLAEFR